MRRKFNFKVFSERLSELRKERGITTKKLGDAIETSDSIISKWENGQRIPGIDKLFKLAIFFGVPSDYLIGLED